MGKESEYYLNKKKNQMVKLRKLMNGLPEFAKDYIYSKEIESQTSTLISYTYDLLTFFDYLENYKGFSKEAVVTDLEKIKSEDIVDYERYLEMSDDGIHENGKKAIARKLSSIRGLYKYHIEHEYIKYNPMLLVKTPRIKKDKNIIRMNEDEVKNVLNLVEFGSNRTTKKQQWYDDRTKLRDLAVMTLMLGTGIRVSECAGLDLQDVNMQEKSITIVRKGGTQDILYFSTEVKKALDNYIKHERDTYRPSEDENALFLSLKHNRLSVDSIQSLVKKYAKIAVPNKKITPHKLRSTYGTALYRKTGDIRLVADVLGHENMNTTVTYYAAIEDEHKRQAANAITLRS